MTANSSIEWTDHTWTPIAGCDAISPACARCYAATMAARLEAMGVEKYRGLATRHGAHGKWTGEVTLWEPEIERPLDVKKPGRWFLTSMGDVFHPKVPFEFVDRLFAVMALAERHTFYILTKRPDMAAKYLSEYSEPELEDVSRDCLVEGEAQAIWNRRTGEDPSMWLEVHWPLKNVFIGCTAEDQERADERRPHMDEISGYGWKTIVSYEPALELVNWRRWEFLSWMISGGESGHGARPSHPDWHRAARDFAAANSIPYFFKQWGEWAPLEWAPHVRSGVLPAPAIPCDINTDTVKRGKKRTGRLLDGVEHNGFPEIK